jgi:hypothetical protein
MKARALKAVQRIMNATLVQVFEILRVNSAVEKQMRANRINNHFFNFIDELFSAVESQMDAFEALLSSLSYEIQAWIAQLADYQQQQANEERRSLDRLIDLEKTLCLASPLEIRMSKLAQAHHKYTSMQRELGEKPQTQLDVLRLKVENAKCISPTAMQSATSSPLDWLRSSALERQSTSQIHIGSVGLQITDTKPPAVASIRNMFDENNVRQGMPGYSNKLVMIGDNLIEINGQNCQMVRIVVMYTSISFGDIVLKHIVENFRNFCC